MDPKRPARKKHKHKKKTAGSSKVALKPRDLFPFDFIIHTLKIRVGLLILEELLRCCDVNRYTEIYIQYELACWSELS